MGREVMDQWTRHARWAYRDMYPQLVAELFDISIECLLQDVAAGSPVYPRPREVGLGNPTWIAGRLGSANTMSGSCAGWAPRRHGLSDTALTPLFVGG